MIKSVKDYPIDEVFKKNASFYYVIPKYQREYVWKLKQWTELYDDITGNDAGYFIGSIICINTNANSFNANRLEIVDGQQRLTTLILFLAAIYSRLKMHEAELGEDDSDILADIKKSIICKEAPNGIILNPQVENKNLEDFLYIMYENGFVKTGKKESNWKIRRIPKCYMYFCKRIDEDMQDNKNSIKYLIEVWKKVMRAVLVKIDVDSHAGAYTLFETLNNRGIPLSAVDLMKNLILAKADENGMSPDKCYDRWLDLMERITEEQAVQERFFRQYYNAFKTRLNKPFRKPRDKKKDPLGPIATKTNILSIIERLINHDLESFLDDILICGEYYSWFVQTSDAPSKYRKSLEQLSHIQGTPSYILLMYLFRYQSDLDISDKDMVKIIKLLTIFFVRRNATDIPSTRDIPRIMMNIISDIESKKVIGKDIYIFIHDYLMKRGASDDEFAESLRGNIYEDNIGVARFVLCALAEKYMTKETMTNLWEQNDSSGVKMYVWTIEHIFPEGKNIPKCWIDMIADGNKALAKQYQEEYVHTLGNLTITGFNSNLSNSSFIDKRDKKNSQKKYIGYKNGLEINKSIARKKKWTVKDIQDRTEKMVSELVKMFSI